MPASYIYKAEGERGKRGIFLTPQEDARGSPYAILPDGRKVSSKYVNTNEGRHQYLFGNDILGQQGVKIHYNNQVIDLEDSNKSYEGNNPFDGWSYRNKGDLGSGGGGGMGGGGFAPGQIGQYGFYPAYIPFPSPTFASFNSIQTAPYKYTDPMKFAEKYGDFNRGEIQKNFDLSKDLALRELDTELSNLRSFVPAASAIKRQELSLDNQFNQGERTRQFDSTLPGAREALAAQTDRAKTLAEGRLPSSIEDRAFEVASRSASADMSAAGGFGARSSVSRKASDLMSAQQRLQVSQYGDQLLTGSIGNRANLLLAPTAYSDAGQQVRVMPSVSPASLIANNLGQLNSLTTIPTAAAFQGEVQQRQYETNLEQGTRQFNAQGEFQESQYNAGVSNQFALGKFGYDVAYAGGVAGAAQTNANTEFAIAQQEKAQQIFQDYQGQAQSANQISAITGAVSGIISSIAGFSNAFGGGGNSGGGDGGSVGGSSGGGGYSGDSGGSSSGPSFTPGDSAPAFDASYDNPAPAADQTYTPGAELPAFSPDFSDGGGSYDGGGFRSAQPSYMQSAPAQMSAFTADTGIGLSNSVGPDANQGVTRALMTAGTTTLNTAGVYDTPLPGTQVIGASNTGRMMFSNQALLKSTNADAGAELVGGFKSVLDPTGVFSAEDSTNLDKIAAVSRDTDLAARLSVLSANGDKKGFVNEILNRFGQPAVQSLVDDPQNKAGVGAAFSAYQLAQNWDKMSPAQKGLGLASIGLQGYKFATGESLATKNLISPVVEGGKVVQPGLSVGQGLALFQAGYNTYSLVKNWDQLNAIQKVAGSTGTAAGIANLAKSFGMLGSGTTGAAVPGVTAQTLAQSGLTNAPQFGIGAVTGNAGAQIPAGYQVVSQTGDQIIALPAANAESASGAVTSSSGSVLGTAAGVAAVAAGTYQVYKGWGTGGAQGRLNGALGGSAIAAGLYGMSGGLGVATLANPYLLGGVVAVSVLGNTIKTGKSADQVARDSVRGQFKAAGLIGDDYKVTLADGAKFDIGVDGKGNQHSFRNPDQALAEHSGRGGKLNSWDIDYTNDLDYVSGMAGVGLSRLLSGGKSKNVDQLGNQLGNAGLGNIGYGKDLTPENFDKLMANQRAMYAQSGIKSKSDAYQLANQAYAEGRINESDLVTMHQSFNMMYDRNGFSTAQKLMQGRQRGVETASQTPPQETIKHGDVQAELIPGDKKGASTPVKRPTFKLGNDTSVKDLIPYAENAYGYKTKDQMKMGNRLRYQRSA